MTYSHTGEDKIIVDHIEVDGSIKGQGLNYEIDKAELHCTNDN